MKFKLTYSIIEHQQHLGTKVVHQSEETFPAPNEKQARIKADTILDKVRKNTDERYAWADACTVQSDQLVKAVQYGRVIAPKP